MQEAHTYIILHSLSFRLALNDFHIMQCRNLNQTSKYKALIFPLPFLLCLYSSHLWAVSRYTLRMSIYLATQQAGENHFSSNNVHEPVSLERHIETLWSDPGGRLPNVLIRTHWNGVFFTCKTDQRWIKVFPRFGKIEKAPRICRQPLCQGGILCVC